MSTLLYGGHSDDAAARAMDAARSATPEQVIAGLREDNATLRAQRDALVTALLALDLACSNLDKSKPVWRCGECAQCLANSVLLEVLP